MTIAGNCAGQLVPLTPLPPYDCGLQKVMAILNKPTILLSPDKTQGLQTVLDEYCGDLGNNCRKKTVSQMQDADYLQPLFIVGELNAMTNWPKFNLPVKKLTHGFEINNRKFTGAASGFAFIDSGHIVVSGNSLQAVKDAQLAFTGGYDIMIVQKNKITFVGNYKAGKFNWYNLQHLKAENYIAKQSASFSAVYLSKNFKDTINFNNTDAELKKYAQQFLSLYRLPAPAKKIDWFIHATMREYGMMSGMFGLICQGNNSAGFSVRGAIHTNGFNLPLVKHEYSHYLFDNSVPQTNNPAFFIEGCVEYVTGLNDSNLYKKRIVVAKQYLDSLDYESLIINNNNFYGQYSAANYNVCGIFVKYLVDGYGVDAFKKYCVAADKKEATKIIFKQDFPSLLTGYKTWLGNQ